MGNEVVIHRIAKDNFITEIYLINDKVRKESACAVVLRPGPEGGQPGRPPRAQKI